MVLMSRYDSVRSDEDRLEEAWCVADALVDLVMRRNYFEVVETLELCGIISHREAMHFLGADRWQQTVEEAKGLLQPHHNLSTTLQLIFIPMFK